MTSRIFPCNPKMYDTLGAFRNLPVIYWTQRLKNIMVGDIVYIYLSNPVSKIVFKCVVEETNIPFSEDIMNDREYWMNGYTFDEHQLTRKYLKLRPLQENTGERLNYWDLKAHGETSNLMGPKRIMDMKYLKFIESFF